MLKNELLLKQKDSSEVACYKLTLILKGHTVAL